MFGKIVEEGRMVDGVDKEVHLESVFGWILLGELAVYDISKIYTSAEFTDFHFRSNSAGNNS